MTRRARALESSGLVLDQAKLQVILGEGAPPLDVGRLVLPLGASGPDSVLRGQVGRVYLRRFIAAQIKSLGVISDPEIRAHAENCLALFQQLPAEAMLRSVIRPEFTSWCLRSIEASDIRDTRRTEEISSHLGNFILPLLVEHGVDFADRWIRLVPSTPTSIQLLPLAREITFGRHLPNHVQARCSQSELVLTLRPGLSHAIPLDFLRRGAMPGLADGPSVIEMTTIGDAGFTLICTRNSWYEAYLPRGSSYRASEPYWDIDETERRYLARCLLEGSELIRTSWPEAWSELSASISLVMPLRRDGLRPHNESIPAFRGMIRTSARPSFRAAQSMIHETGHNKFNSILDVYTLFRTGSQAEYLSPFVNAPRPIEGILHGIFAFLVDAHVSMRMLSHIDPKEHPSVLRYVADGSGKVRSALSQLEGSPVLTAAGAQLVEGFRRAHEDLTV